MTDPLAILRRANLFARIETDKLAALLKNLDQVEYPPGTILFNEGDVSHNFYILLAGKIEVVRAMGSPEESVFAVRGAGDMIGDMSFFSKHKRRTAAVRVVEPMQALVMSHERFDQLLQDNPLMAYSMLDTFSYRLTNAERRSIEDLKEKNQQLQEAYDALKAAQAELLAKERLETELRAAHSIQLSILPQSIPEMEGYTLGCYLKTARAVGGDFYNFVQLDKHRLGIVIADVSDKGVPSALFMAQSHALLFAEIIRGFEPARVLARVNRHIMRMNSARQFVTVLYGVLDVQENTFAYARAGHELPILVDPVQGASQAPFKTGQLLGMLENPIFDVRKISIPPGGTLLLYTDGLTDSINDQQEALGLQAVMETLPPMLEMQTTAQDICDHLIQRVRQHQAEADQFDDITLVALRANPA